MTPKVLEKKKNEAIDGLILGLSKIGDKEESANQEGMVRKEIIKQGKCDILEAKCRQCFKEQAMVLETCVRCYWINMKTEK